MPSAALSHDGDTRTAAPSVTFYILSSYEYPPPPTCHPLNHYSTTAISKNV